MTDPAPLFDAVRDGNIDALKRRLAEDPSLARARNEDGLSIVLFALYLGRADAVEALLAGSVPLDIFEAAALGLPERVADLLESDPESAGAFSKDGWTPLHLAAFFGRRAVAELLVSHGADIGAIGRNAMANQPLHAAVAGGHKDICELLLSVGADVNAAQHGGWTALHSAAQQGSRELVDLFLSQGADLEQVNEEGEAAAQTAEKAGHADLAELLRNPKRPL